MKIGIESYDYHATDTSPVQYLDVRRKRHPNLADMGATYTRQAQLIRRISRQALVE